MNFTPYGTPFTSVGSIPAGHQFTAAKLAHQVGAGGNQVLGLISADEAGVTYLRPVDVNGALTVNLPTNSGNSTTHNQIITLPISLPGAKPGDVQQQTLQIVVNPGPGGLTPGEKYHAVPLSLQHFQQGVLTVAYSNAQQGGESIQLQVHQAEAENGTVDHHTQTQQEQSSQHSSSGSAGTNNNNNNNHTDENSGPQPVAQIQHGIQTDEMVLPDVKPILTEAVATSDQGGTPQAYPVAVVAQLPSDLILRNEDLEQAEKNAGKDGKDRTREGENYNAIQASWQSLAAPGSTVADYLSRIPASTLPLSLHHFLKFSAETIKRESAIESSPLSNADGTESTQTADMQTTTGTDPENPDEVDPQSGKAKKKKKYKKKAPKPRRPRPGQVHIATALDGTTLFCCPECNMAYSAKDLLEQHLVSHKIERRFICDICGAGLKRKEHLERHKLGHNPERPYICSVCCKGFKRKEHLNLHFVIHSGEKTEVCPECGKGFYRKDHLRKHARSHLAKRVKEEFSAQQQAQQQQQQAQQAAQQQAQQAAQQQHTTAEQGQQQPQTDVTEQDNGTTTTTVVLPTAAETGAMALLHHQHHHGERIGHHVIALENFNVEETTCEENT